MQGIEGPEPGIPVCLNARFHGFCSKCVMGGKCEHALYEVAAVPVTST